MPTTPPPHAIPFTTLSNELKLGASCCGATAVHYPPALPPPLPCPPPHPTRKLFLPTHPAGANGPSRTSRARTFRALLRCSDKPIYRGREHREEAPENGKREFTKQIRRYHGGLGRSHQRPRSRPRASILSIPDTRHRQTSNAPDPAKHALPPTPRAYVKQSHHQPPDQPITTARHIAHPLPLSPYIGTRRGGHRHEEKHRVGE